MGERLKEKEIEGNMVGEGLTLGGIVLFDKKGVAKFAYVEETGNDLPVQALLIAATAVKEGRDE